MIRLDPDLRRTWLFGPGADPTAHEAMRTSGADVLICDLEDFTPLERLAEARKLLPVFVKKCRALSSVAAIRINQLTAEGTDDLAAVMPTNPDVVVLPMAERSAQISELDAAITGWEVKLGLEEGGTEIVPVCETALGVVDVRVLAAASPRIRCAILGSEDLATDLCAERGADAVELDYARRRFILECRAFGIEPVDAPHTYTDNAGARLEAEFARRLGYHSKALVRPDHVQVLNAVFTPNPAHLAQARETVDSFEAARARGEDRVLVGGLWIEVPSYRNACRLIERARRLGI